MLSNGARFFVLTVPNAFSSTVDLKQGIGFTSPCFEVVIQATDLFGYFISEGW
jgi:hypothetical protein